MKQHILTMHEIGAAIRKRRKALAQSQEKLAAKLGVSRQQIQRYENGTDMLSIERMQAVCMALSVPVSYLLGEEHDAVAETTHEQQLMYYYRSLGSDQAKASVIDVVRLLAAQHTSNRGNGT